MCYCEQLYFQAGSAYLFASGKHEVFKCDFTCPMCFHNKKKFGSHSKYNHICHYFSCEYCHKYARKTDKFRNTVLEEYFFVLDYFVIMNKNTVIVKKGNEQPITLPFFIFETEEQLIKKIKMYTLFS
jgi:hypothetical protein